MYEKEFAAMTERRADLRRRYAGVNSANDRFEELSLRYDFELRLWITDMKELKRVAATGIKCPRLSVKVRSDPKQQNTPAQ
jgi:hypothetical protein